MPSQFDNVGIRTILANEFVFDILLRRAAAIRNEQRDDARYKLSCADLAGLKELRKTGPDLDAMELELELKGHPATKHIAFDIASYMNNLRNSDLLVGRAEAAALAEEAMREDKAREKKMDGRGQSQKTGQSPASAGRGQSPVRQGEASLAPTAPHRTSNIGAAQLSEIDPEAAMKKILKQGNVTEAQIAKAENWWRRCWPEKTRRR